MNLVWRKLVKTAHYEDQLNDRSNTTWHNARNFYVKSSATNG